MIDPFSQIIAGRQPTPVNSYMHAKRPAACWLVVCLFLATLLTGGSAGAEPPEQQVEQTEQIDQLIRDLTSSSFRARELASERLFALGGVAKKQMRQSRDRTTDPEQADRLDRIIALLNENELESDIDTFLKGESVDLEGWPIFEQRFDDSPQARQMFIDLFREHPYVVRALGGSKREISQALAKVNGRLRTRGVGETETPQRIDLLAFLLPLTTSSFEADAQYDMQITALLQLHPASELRGDKAFGEPFLKLVSKWMLKSHLSIRERVLRLALDWEMDVAHELAIETLSHSPGPQLLCRSLQAIARRGSEQDSLRIVQYLDDPSIVVPKQYIGSRGNDVLVSDVAAAVIAHLHGATVVSVGFSEPAEHPILGIVYEELVVRPEPSNDSQKENGDEDEGALEMTEEERELFNDITEQLRKRGLQVNPRELEQFKRFQRLRRRQTELRLKIRNNVLTLMGRSVDSDHPQPPAAENALQQ